MNSQGHRNNITKSNFTEIGVGYAVDKNGRGLLDPKCLFDHNNREIHREYSDS